VKGNPLLLWAYCHWAWRLKISFGQQGRNWLFSGEKDIGSS